MFTVAGCADKFDFCERHSIKAMCDRDSSIRDVVCRKSCGMCGTETTEEPEDCKNNWSWFWCTVYQFSCSTSRVRQNCQKTCSACT